MIKSIFLIILALFIVGCSGKESILVPGQMESDCDDKASKLGLCGTPKAIYENKQSIKNLWYEEDESYYVAKNGNIYNTDTHERVFPGERPKGCNNAICPNCDDAVKSEHTNTGSYSHFSSNGANLTRIQNRSLIIDTKQKTTMIRDLGWQQKIWIAPMHTKGDDLIEAHGVHVVVKKPSWIIGEEIPKGTRRGVVVPSLVATEVLTDNHNAISRKTNNIISNYVLSKKNKSHKNIKKYIKEKKKDKK